MKKNIISLALSAIFSSVIAQNPGEYLERRFSVGLDLDPSMQGVVRSTFNSLVFEDTKYFEVVRLNTRLGINADYALSERTSLSFCLSKFNDELISVYTLPTPKSYGSGKYFTGVQQLKSTMIGCKFTLFTQKKYPIPKGLYINMGLYLINTKIIDKDNVYGENGAFSQNGYIVEDPEFSQMHQLISFGIGKRVVLAKDRFILDYGVAIGLYTGLLSKRINIYDPDGNNTRNDYEIQKNLQIQLGGRLATNIRLGINYLLF